MKISLTTKDIQRIISDKLCIPACEITISIESCINDKNWCRIIYNNLPFIKENETIIEGVHNGKVYRSGIEDDKENLEDK